MLRRKVLFYQNNVRVHTSVETVTEIHSVASNASHCPDLTAVIYSQNKSKMFKTILQIRRSKLLTLLSTKRLCLWKKAIIVLG